MDLTPDWEYVADTVMGGVSTGQITREVVGGRAAVRLTGDVSLDNNGGFVQMAFDTDVDASVFVGVEFDAYGNGETYELRARTDALTRPWQSFRATFVAPAEWTTIRIPFADLEAHRTDARFVPGELRRLGLLAIGREFRADLAVSGIRLFQ
nr:CIA30 family protein [Jannaschia faecimaris]